jgi:hypothetical protein
MNLHSKHTNEVLFFCPTFEDSHLYSFAEVWLLDEEKHSEQLDGGETILPKLSLLIFG